MGFNCCIMNARIVYFEKTNLSRGQITFRPIFVLKIKTVPVCYLLSIIKTKKKKVIR